MAINNEELKAAEQAFLECDAQWPEIKAFLSKFSDAKAELIRVGGVGHHFQGPDGRVHETVEQKFKSVAMEPVAVNSTTRNEGDKGSLSVKRAQELGYTVPAKKPKENGST